MAEDIWGIGFKSADRIALSMGIAQQDPRRARAGLLFALGEAANDAHCFVEQPILISLCHKLLDPEEELAGLQTMIAAEIPALIADRKIVTDEERIYLAPLFYAEKGAAGDTENNDAEQGGNHNRRPGKRKD